MVVLLPWRQCRESNRTHHWLKAGMATNIKQIIYFHHRLDATAAAIRKRRSDIDMVRRDFADPAVDIWADMSRAHGYHACARTEMREPWFPDARLFAKAPTLLDRKS